MQQPGQSVVAEKRISANEFWFSNENALDRYPGCFLVEMAAQAAGLAACGDESGRGGMLCSVREFTFDHAIHVGDLLTIKVDIEGRFGALVAAQCTITCDCRVAAFGHLSLRIQ